MSPFIDPIHFQDLSAKDPADVCCRAACRYDRADRSYTLSVWDEEIVIFPHQQKIESASNGNDRYPLLHLFAIHYLLGSKDAEPSGTWISEKEIPGGATFFRGPHRIPTEVISNRFSNAVGDFQRRCERTGGVAIPMADAAYRFEMTPRIPVAVLYWRGDEDFPAEAKILYDRTITVHLAMDVIYALAVGICKRLGRAPEVVS